MTRHIPLTRGRVALVDDADYEWLSQWRWAWIPSSYGNGVGYACRTDRSTGRAVSIWMHREVSGVADDAEGDHRDRNSLNNQRANLRAATHQQNTRNRSYTKGRVARRGTVFRRGRYLAIITVDAKQIALGGYRSEIEAAIAYDRAAEHLFGEFAVLNFEPGRDWIFPYAPPASQWKSKVGQPARRGSRQS